MKNNLEDKNSYKSLTFNQFLCSDKDRPSSLVDFCEDKDNEFEFGEPWHTKNLPSFPLIEGETYLVPLKLLAKERRFDEGRGTEFYLFGDCERLGCYVSFSDKYIPRGIKQIE